MKLLKIHGRVYAVKENPGHRTRRTILYGAYNKLEAARKTMVEYHAPAGLVKRLDAIIHDFDDIDFSDSGLDEGGG
jgi:hypothetical protein